MLSLIVVHRLVAPYRRMVESSAEVLVRWTEQIVLD
jgi:hypothetical protein